MTIVVNSVAQALHQAASWLDEIPGVSGVGESEFDGEPCILVLVHDEDSARRVPRTVAGVRVVVEIVGEIEPH